MEPIAIASNTPAGSYRVAIRATNTCGSVDYLGTITVGSGGCGFFCSFSLSPNPSTNDGFALSCEGDIKEEEIPEYEMVLVGLNGEIKMKKKSNRFNTRKLKAGIYILRLRKEGEKGQKRIIIEK